MSAGGGRDILRAHGGPNGLVSDNFNIKVSTPKLSLFRPKLRNQSRELVSYLHLRHTERERNRSWNGGPGNNADRGDGSYTSRNHGSQDMDSSVQYTTILSIHLHLANRGDRLHLAHHILYESRLLGRTSTDRGEGDPAPVLELGAGTGFLSILLAKLGADVVTTDLGAEEEDQDVETTTRRTPLARLRQNVNLGQ